MTDTAGKHSLVFSSAEYAIFREILKTQVILKQEQVFGFFLDDMILDDRGDHLRFKLAYMPPWLRRLDVYLTRDDNTVTLTWTDPKYPVWEIIISAALSAFIGYKARSAFPPSTDYAPIVFVAWTMFWCARRRKHLREGAERFLAAMNSMTRQAQYRAAPSEAATPNAGENQERDTRR
jgi:hypothetical protein